jgi:hypothetical protein
MRRSSFSNIRLAKKSLSLGLSWLIMMWLIKNIAYSDGRLLAHWLQLCGQEQLCLFCNTTVAVDYFGAVHIIEKLISTSHTSAIRAALSCAGEFLFPKINNLPTFSADTYGHASFLLIC